MNSAELISLACMQPVNEAEALKRALYYCHAVHLCCKRQLRYILTLANGGQLGAQTREVVVQGISDWKSSSATKILACINLHLTGLTRTAASNEPWLSSFLAEALRESDQLFPTPPAAEIIELHGAWSRDQMVEDVADHILSILGMHSADASAAGLLQQFLIDFEATGDELLVFALSQPADALRNHLKTLES